ncbi:F-box only protein 31-like [Crassostrea angulata]|uniref:F-box only protein 31-like n=1 Tax=Magallana angulata TaxID=2784310 RepID=UPI0022B17669|nr:F-box only protein 31-like [Crassostrea angulata]
MTTILSLPPELLTRILDYVYDSELPSVCLSCKTLRDVVYNHSIWQKKCKQEYNFKSIEGWNVNYCILYNKVLRRYGELVGFWRRDSQYYGGLLQIKFDKGCIKGLEVLPPAGSSVDRPLRMTEIFTISMTSSETVQIVSVHNFPKEEDGEEKDVQRPCLLHVEENERNKRILEYKVTDKKYILQKEDLNNHPVLKRWLDEDFLERGVDYLSSRHEYRWSPLELSSNSVSNVPIQPGLFKGACCLRGIEILSLYYTEDLRMLMVTNITGVQHTPARKFIIHGILGRPRVLTVEQQESEDILSAAHRHNENEHPDRPAAQQPFRIPKDCFHQDIPDIPKFCTFRCTAVACFPSFDKFTNTFDSHECVAHFVVFDERKFGLCLRSSELFILYIRVDDNELKD